MGEPLTAPVSCWSSTHLLTHAHTHTHSYMGIGLSASGVNLNRLPGKPLTAHSRLWKFISPSSMQGGRRTAMVTMPMMGVCSTPLGQDSNMAPPSPQETLWGVVSIWSTDLSSLPRMGSASVCWAGLFLLHLGLSVVGEGAHYSWCSVVVEVCVLSVCGMW